MFEKYMGKSKRKRDSWLSKPQTNDLALTESSVFPEKLVKTLLFLPKKSPNNDPAT